jgi:hypothetical protein
VLVFKDEIFGKEKIKRGVGRGGCRRSYEARRRVKMDGELRGN